MASVVEIMDALASQIEQGIGGTADPAIENLQVIGRLNPLMTPPSIDIYPGSPFQEKHAYRPASQSLFFTVRARVNTPDHAGAQEVLLSMMDPSEDTSVEQAIMADKTLGGVVANVAIMEGPSEYGIFREGDGEYLGTTWRVQVIP